MQPFNETGPGEQSLREPASWWLLLVLDLGGRCGSPQHAEADARRLVRQFKRLGHKLPLEAAAA